MRLRGKKEIASKVLSKFKFLNLYFPRANNFFHTTEKLTKAIWSDGFFAALNLKNLSNLVMSVENLLKPITGQ